MNLPQREPRPWHALGMHLVEHEPAADPDARLHFHERRESLLRPPGMRDANARRDLDDDALAFPLVRRLRQPQVIITRLGVGLVAVRRLGEFHLVVGDVALHLYGCPFIAGDVSRLAGRPLISEAIADSPRPRDARERLPRDR